jgi:hypothetical protein
MKTTKETIKTTKKEKTTAKEKTTGRKAKQLEDKTMTQMATMKQESSNNSQGTISQHHQHISNFPTGAPQVTIR